MQLRIAKGTFSSKFMINTIYLLLCGYKKGANRLWPCALLTGFPDSRGDGYFPEM
jgi:hypothetical protein